MTQTSSSARPGQVLAQTAGSMENGAGSEKLFYEIQDGNGFTYRIANMNNRLVCPRKGIVQIEAISRHKGKQANFGFCNVFDSKLKIWYGVPMGINQATKEIIWKRFYLPEWRQYNLAVEEDAIEWAIVSRSNFMEGSPYAAGRPAYKKYDLEAEAEAKIERISAIKEAVEIVTSLKLKDWISVARFFGKNPENMSVNQLRAEAYTQADRNPKEFISYWTNTNRQVIDIFNAAKAYGLVSYNVTKGWLFRNTMPIGNTEQQAIAYVIQNPEFAQGLAMAVKDKDVTEKIIKRNEAPEQIDFDKITGKDNRELVELQMRAQLLGIKGYDIMSEEELKEAVKAAESSEVDLDLE